MTMIERRIHMENQERERVFDASNPTHRRLSVDMGLLMQAISLDGDPENKHANEKRAEILEALKGEPSPSDLIRDLFDDHMNKTTISDGLTGRMISRREALARKNIQVAITDDLRLVHSPIEVAEYESEAAS